MSLLPSMDKVRAAGEKKGETNKDGHYEEEEDF
jgi:hypothetical protein